MFAVFPDLPGLPGFSGFPAQHLAHGVAALQAKLPLGNRLSTAPTVEQEDAMLLTDSDQSTAFQHLDDPIGADACGFADLSDSDLWVILQVSHDRLEIALLFFNAIRAQVFKEEFEQLSTFRAVANAHGYPSKN
jgi:hypothetical protein